MREARGPGIGDNVEIGRKTCLETVESSFGPSEENSERPKRVTETSLS